jgi:hypothetical protein
MRHSKKCQGGIGNHTYNTPWTFVVAHGEEATTVQKLCQWLQLHTLKMFQAVQL